MSENKKNNQGIDGETGKQFGGEEPSLLDRETAKNTPAMVGRFGPDVFLNDAKNADGSYQKERVFNDILSLDEAVYRYAGVPTVIEWLDFSKVTDTGFDPSEIISRINRHRQMLGYAPELSEDEISMLTGSASSSGNEISDIPDDTGDINLDDTSSF